MGSYVSSIVEEQTKKSQDFMGSMQETTMGRQMQMQNYMREQAMAMQLARGRDLFHWWGAFFSTAAFFGTVGFLKTKKPAPLVPLIPLSFVGAYYYDLAYGSKVERMQQEAKKILSEERHLIELPTGLPSMALLDERRKQSRKD